MFKQIIKPVWGGILASVFAVNSYADDIDMFSGTVTSATAPAELIFALDTSTSMACALDQVFNNDQSKCFLNVHPEILNDPDYSVGLSYEGLGDYQIPNNVKILNVRSVLDQVLSDVDVLSDDVRVGLAFYNEPGGAIIQPLRPLGESTSYSSYPTQRDLVKAEIANVMPQGTTPILGTLLEIGHYIQSAPVIAGHARKPEHSESLDENLYPLFNSPFIGQIAEPVGETARISHVDTIMPNTGAYSANAGCDGSGEGVDPIAIKSDSNCVSEHLERANGMEHILYNENVNSASVCEANDDLSASAVTTKIILITDGVSQLERMDRVINGARMATWVKRFITGNNNATGFLGANYFSQAQNYPEDGQFEDEGCPITANTTGETFNWYEGFDLELEPIPADGGEPVDILLPSLDDQKKEYDSCLLNVANRFRELGVEIHVIGFTGGDELAEVQNSNLEKMAAITGGQFVATSDPDVLRAALQNLSAESGKAASLDVPLSPATSVNPGSILSNSDEIYMPMFKASNSSFMYGNLRKYRLEKTDSGVSIVGANGAATEECTYNEGDPDTETVFTCFKDDSRDLWSDANNGKTVTKGGAAEQLGVYGPDPDGDRKVFIQNEDSVSLLELNLVAGTDAVTGAPDEDAFASIDAIGVSAATKNYYANLVENPSVPGTTFESFEALSAHQDADTLLADNNAIDMLRWLAGFDKKRFDSDGLFAVDGALSERDLLGESAPAADSTDETLSRLYYGAIIHSQPTIVNYGFTENNDGSYTFDNVVYVSGNDGYLRAIDADTGAEEFSFFPQALLSSLPAIYRNDPGKFTYGLDSTWTAWRQDLPDGEGLLDGQISDGNGFVRLFGGMRRGGYSYYFLDVTDRNSPELLKEIVKGDDNFERIGQTWSQPVLAKVREPGNTLPTVVTIFGGGFDPDYDAQPAPGPCTDIPATENQAATEIPCGNQIYIVKAGGYSGQLSDTNTVGDILWWASDYGTASDSHVVVSNMKHSIPAKVKTIDIDDDGLVDRIYVGDLGGQLFRVVINNDATDASDFISVSTVAQVGHEGFITQNAANNRMFFETPSVAVMKPDGGTKHIGIAIGSGWRENPFDKTVEEELYYFRDDFEISTPAPAIIKRPDGDFGTTDFITHLENIADASAEIQSAFSTAKGIALSLNADDAYAGEKTFGSPVILLGNVFYLTYLPPSDDEFSNSETSCLPPPNRSRLTAFRVNDGAPRFFINNEGVMVKGDNTSGIPVVARTEESFNAPINGMGVHMSGESFTLLSSTEAINIPLDSETIKKTKWEHVGSGKNVELQNPVSLE